MAGAWTGTNSTSRKVKERLEADRRFQADYCLEVADLNELARSAASELGYELDDETIDDRVMNEVADR